VIKRLNFDLDKTREFRKLQLDELEEIKKMMHMNVQNSTRTL